METAIKDRKAYISVEEYVSLLRESQTKWEYVDGQVYAMAGGTPNHSLISANITRELGNTLKGTSCRAYNADLEIAISWSRYLFADASVVCGPVETFEVHKNAVKNPTLIVEVMSDSTKGYNKDKKFFLYQQIPTLREYVLIDQEEPIVIVHYKTDAHLWRYSAYQKMDDLVLLESIGVQIPVSEIYEGIEFNALV